MRAHLFLQAQTMAVGIEFVLYMVELARLLVQGRGKQSLENEQRHAWLTLLWRKPQKMAFKNSIYFVTDRSFTTDGGLL